MGYIEKMYFCGEKGHPGGTRNGICPKCGKKLRHTLDQLNKKLADSNNNRLFNASTKDSLKESDAKITALKPPNSPKEPQISQSKEKDCSADEIRLNKENTASKLQLHEQASKKELPFPTKSDFQIQPSEDSKLKEVSNKSPLENTSSTEGIKPKSKSIIIKKNIVSSSNKSKNTIMYFNEDGFYDDVIGEVPPRPDRFPYKAFIHLIIGTILFFLLQIYSIYFIWW